MNKHEVGFVIEMGFKSQATMYSSTNLKSEYLEKRDWINKENELYNGIFFQRPLKLVPRAYIIFLA